MRRPGVKVSAPSAGTPLRPMPERCGPVTDQDLAARLDAIECRLDAAYPEPPDVPDPDRIDALAERLADVEGALEAVEGYVGEIERVDDELERRADAALAATETIEDRLADLDADVEVLEERLDELVHARPRAVDTGPGGPVADERPPVSGVARTSTSTAGSGPAAAAPADPVPGSGRHDVGPEATGVSSDPSDATEGRSDAAPAGPGVAPAGTDAASTRPNGGTGRAGQWAPAGQGEASQTAVGDGTQRAGPPGGVGGGPSEGCSNDARTPPVDGDGASVPGSVPGAGAPSRSAAGAPSVSSWGAPGDGTATASAVVDDTSAADERDWDDEEGETLLDRLRDLL